MTHQSEKDPPGTTVLIMSQSLNGIRAALNAEVLHGMKHGDQEFGGVMIDNGVARSPSGLPAYIRCSILHTALCQRSSCIISDFSTC